MNHNQNQWQKKSVRGIGSGRKRVRWGTEVIISGINGESVSDGDFKT